MKPKEVKVPSSGEAVIAIMEMKKPVISKLTFAEHFLCARLCTECCTDIMTHHCQEESGSR